MKDHAPAGTIDLCGEWELTDETGKHRLPMTLPGDGITALHRAGILPDPYFARNEEACRWVAGRDWTVRSKVSIGDPGCELVMEGLDTVCEVRVNGMEVLRAANAFRTWRADLSGAAKSGENEVEIVFRSSPRTADALQAAQPFHVPYHEGNCPIPNGNMLRKPQCDFGWDWNVALAPFGLTGGIRIEPRGPRIAAIVVGQDHGERLLLTVRVEASGAEGEMVAVGCAGATAVTRVSGGCAAVELDVTGAELWWPAGHGAQWLHELTVSLDDVTETRRVGLCTVEHVTEGGVFGFRVNGRDVFCRGANWIPADALAGRITRERVRDLLQSAVAANMNMIRIWGGGRYEADWFYDICDELGLMVWQDFMFACHLYPSTPEFLAEVAEEVRENVRRLNHHPSIALWCGDNELVGALGWYEESREDRDRYLVSYDRLNRTIETALRDVLPDANWWPSSPSPGPLGFGDAWHDDRSGDMHFWSVWHEGKDFEHYRSVAPRFCSEFGFQSYPSIDVIRTFAEPQDQNIASPVLEAHQKNAGGNARIAETMFRCFRWPTAFEDFVYLSQVQQTLAMQTAVDHWRSLKPHCRGMLYWQLNDTWPCASWSSLDYGGGWKLMHHVARRFYAPLRAVVVPQADGYVVRAVNDGPEPASMVLEVFAADPAGEIRRLATAKADVPPGAAVELTRVPSAAVEPQEILIYRWAGGNGERGEEHFAPRPYKSYDLLPSAIRSTVEPAEGGWKITLESGALALFVAIETQGRLSDNCFTLLPGAPRTVHLATETAEVPALRIRDLHGATHN